MGDVRESSLSEIFCTLLLLNSAKLRSTSCGSWVESSSLWLQKVNCISDVKRYRAGACCVPAPEKHSRSIRKTKQQYRRQWWGWSFTCLNAAVWTSAEKMRQTGKAFAAQEEATTPGLWCKLHRWQNPTKVSHSPRKLSDLSSQLTNFMRQSCQQHMLFWGYQTIPTKQSCVLETEDTESLPQPTSFQMHTVLPAPLHSIPLLPGWPPWGHLSSVCSGSMWPLPGEPRWGVWCRIRMA